MTKQLPLDLKEQLIYGAENFVQHQGVQGLIQELDSLACTDLFSIVFANGIKRSGKSHLAVFLYEKFKYQGLLPLLLSGPELSSLLAADLSVLSRNLFIFDDFDFYLQTVQAGDSGPLVAFIEKCRVAKAKLFLFSGQTLDAFQCDDHILSRLLVGQGYEIKNPSENDFSAIFQALCRQRGIKLKDRQLDFVAKRLGRSIFEIENYVDRLYLLAMQHGKTASFELLQQAIIPIEE